MRDFLKFLIYFLQFILGLTTGEETDTSDDETETDTDNIETDTDTVETIEHKIIVLIDNGHASCTPGKRSPKLEDGSRFFEYAFNRDIVARLAKRLAELNIKYEILVPEVDEDIALSKRAARANQFCKEYGKENCIFISVHANAMGNGEEWKTARGWSCYTSKGETVSDKYAEIFMKCAENVLLPLNQKVRKFSDKKYSWEDNFTVLVKTICPAILTENLFYDNKKDLAFLQSEEGKEAISQIHVDAILEIEKNLTV